MADRTEGGGDLLAFEKEGRAEEGGAAAGDAEDQVDEPCVEGAGCVPGVNHADEKDDPPHDERGKGSPAEGAVEFPIQEFPDPPSQDDPEHPDIYGGGDGGG